MEMTTVFFYLNGKYGVSHLHYSQSLLPSLFNQSLLILLFSIKIFHPEHNALINTIMTSNTKNNAGVDRTPFSLHIQFNSPTMRNTHYRKENKKAYLQWYFFLGLTGVAMILIALKMSWYWNCVWWYHLPQSFSIEIKVQCNHRVKLYLWKILKRSVLSCRTTVEVISFKHLAESAKC